MKHPRLAPLVNDLRPQRLARGRTQVAAATVIGSWPGTISRIELGKCRDREAIVSYRNWLEEQAEERS